MASSLLVSSLVVSESVVLARSICASLRRLALSNISISWLLSLASSISHASVSTLSSAIAWISTVPTPLRLLSPPTIHPYPLIYLILHYFIPFFRTSQVLICQYKYYALLIIPSLLFSQKPYVFIYFHGF